MYQVKTVALAVLCLADVKEAEDQALEEREAAELEVARDLQRMDDPRRPKKNWMPRWRIIGELRKMATALRLGLLKMIST